MFVGLIIKPIWSDVDMIEIQITASNGHFSGRTGIYISHGTLAETAELLTGFPKTTTDKRLVEFGAFGPNLAKGAARLDFHCLTHSGPVELQVRIGSDPQLKERVETAEFFLRVEPASIDRFVNELRIAEADRKAATLVASDT